MSEKFPFQLLISAHAEAKARDPVLHHNKLSFIVAEYVLEGAGFLEQDGIRYNIGKDSIYFLHKGTTHTYGQLDSAPWKKLFFSVDGELAAQLMMIYGIADVNVISDAMELRQYFETMYALNENSERVHQKAAVIFHEFIEACAEHLHKPADSAPPVIQELKNTLTRSVETPFTLRDFCIVHQVTTAYAVRAFHRHYGCPPGEYLLRLRLENAKRLLRFTELSIKEIAAKMNFSDQYHFSNFYKKRTGEAPENYKKKWH